MEWIPKMSVFLDLLNTQMHELCMLCLCVTSLDCNHKLKNKIEIIFSTHSVRMELMVDV